MIEKWGWSFAVIVVVLLLLLTRNREGKRRRRVQNNARHPDTFSPKTISLPRDKYDAMVRAFRLPRRGIETSAVVGPFFWSWVDELDSRPYMRT